MYLELIKRFDGGKSLKLLDPIEDMEIEYDSDVDDMDIKELLSAMNKIKQELKKPAVVQISKA